ncbi:membrane fusion protein, Cu(I)/Ag(I) efflux system [Arenibacter nanhaiticus]|uniref:Membrane fusion protein, Cu(I)/Ag(I) efflux system n=1 Tax=Arenibacter nanhaiticus TaxID=558155 RepID=A0A1M6CS43_9FLAO|nr:efflux RND transporter periplasmic adaptor subunit [Arenibacter nanhaiticus]SHI63806.1 membrane fusion protein, Cu(I)/Ag(I) efflux system [Arenibacter nanhaiticus]
MKKYILYVGILLAGLLMGWLLFGESASKGDQHDPSGEVAESQLWTCSMHPQIMQPEAGDCPICGMDLIPAESGADGLAADQFKMTKNAMALANVQTAIVGAGEAGENKLKLSGKIKENEEANAVQASYFEGRVEKLGVSFTGETVKKGQLLATIYAPALVAAQQELITAASLKATQPALYKAVRNKLKLWKLSEGQIDQIETSGKVRENFPIYATVAGTVSEKMVQEGDYVKQGQPLFKIADLNSVWAVFDAYENQIPSLKVGQTVKITAKAYPNKEFEAKISFIDPRLNTSTRTLMVRATLQNKDATFKPGMFVEGNIDILGKQNDEVVVIPESAVLWTGKRSLVYIKESGDEPIFQLREVSLGTLGSGRYTVFSGLENGEEIVVNGAFTVDAAAQLMGKKSMMNQSGGKTMTGHEGHHPGSMGQETATELKIEWSATFEAEFKKVITAYFEMKDALVASDGALASAAAKNSLAPLKKLAKDKGLDESAKEYMAKLEQQYLTISQTGDLEKQRAEFVTLSDNMITIGANLKEISAPIYIQHCPMANINKGAYWLSMEKEVKNPYYGDSMLRCGSVVDSIK